jgi:hypothetical protein
VILQLQPAGLGCACGGGCPSCSGLGDANTDALMASLSAPVDLGFTTLPVWAVAGGAVLVLWWLTWPSGSEYRAKRKALRSQYSGIAKIRKRKRRVASGLRTAVT